jgi:hypothetical protein
VELRCVRKECASNFQAAGLAGRLAINSKRGPGHRIQAALADRAATVRASSERTLPDPPQTHHEAAFDARLAIQAYHREIPVQLELSLFDIVGGDAVQTLPGSLDLGEFCLKKISISR